MKETHYKLKQRVTALFAAAVMLCSMLPGAAFAEEPTPQPTEETVQMEQQTEPSETDNGQTDESSPDPGEDVTEATPETAEEQPAEEEISAAVVGAELYTDLPDTPIGSYIGSEGLPVATGETKIGISEWPESQLEETSDSYLTAAALDNDGLTMAAPLLDGADYAIVPIMAQVEYPADGSSTDMILPDGVTLLDFYGEPATDADALLHNSYHETSAAVMGVYVQAAADFNAQLVYTGSDGSTQTKTLYVTIDREHTVASPFADAGIAAYGERPIPDVTSGKITKVAKVNGTWLIWFNGEPAYCCTPGADGQPKNCPTYTYVNTSMVGADQYVPGDHYGNQYRIWGGLTQLSLGMQELPPVALSAEAPSLLDSCRTIYTDAQMQIIENYPDSTAAKILMGSAQALLEGTDAYASARGYYTYIYQPGRAGWQTVAVIGPEISDDEPNPKPIVQEIYANWEAPAQTASGSFDFDYGIITDKVQLKTNEKVDGATIEIEPITKSGTIDGGTWNISPADKQTVTTSGHTNDDNFQNNGGAASASWTLHYSVSKTTDSRSGRVGPYTTQDEADAAADSARDAAIAELQGEAQRMVDNAVASAKAELANVKFRYEEVGVPYGFAMYWGSNGSNQTISVPANSNNAYLMKNDEWSLQVNIKKTDSETGNQIAADAQYEIFQWDTVTGKYQPTGGYNTYSVQRQGDGTYAVINSAAYVTTDSMRHTLYYTQRNTGKFIIVESKAPTGYFGDWTDINHPGMAKNQFSTVSKGKALDGSWTYDAYYLSFADGYLVDEHNYYITPAYSDEGWYVEKTTFADNRQAAGEQIDKTSYSANYHIHADNALAESQDQAAKGNVEISKIVSSSGQSNGLELEGAGFTFFLVSDLSKLKQFEQTRSGSYTLQSILDAYIDKTYDNEHPKWDFSAETQAIAKTYEVNADEIAAYNKTLTAAGENKNGKGDGWQPTGSANEYQLAEIFSNDTGNIRVQGLPYGTYLVVETTVPHDLFQAEPFIVTVDPEQDNNPWGAMATPKDSVMTGSDSYQKFTVLDEEIEVYLRITKVDEETGKPVLLPDTAFQIYWLDEQGHYRYDSNGNPKLVTMTDTVNGHLTKDVDTFYTNSEGILTLPEKLPLGKYRIVEVTGPNGFYNEWLDSAGYENGILTDDADGIYYVDFEITTDRIYAATGDKNENGMDTLVIGENYSNHETLGKLTIRKTGEVLAGWKTEAGALDPWMTGEAEDGNFVYETRPLAGAEYTITAAEDIHTQDRQTDNYGNRTLWYAKGDVVAVVTTGDGSADIAAFAPARTKATYDFLSVINDGTIGEVSVTLPLGSYHIEETKPPYGYIGTTESYDVTFAWDNELNDVVMATSIAKVDGAASSQSFEVVRSKDANADFIEQQTLKFYNDREKAKVGVYKVDRETGKYLAGAVFNLYTADDIYSVDGKLLFAAGELVATSPETGADGYTYFDCDIPIRGEYYGSSIRKDATTNSGNYIVKELRAPLGYYVNEEPMEVTFTYDGQAIMVLDNTCSNKPTEMWVSKRDLTNDEELPGATLAIKDMDGNIVTTWVSTDEPHRVTGLHFGESYTLTEIRAADGYALADNITFRLIQKTDEGGNPLEECEVYYLTTKNILFWKWDDWRLLDDATVIMRDDITKVQISKKDLTTKEELPGAELTLTDEKGNEIDRWVSTDAPHYMEKLPAGKYTLTEVTAPDGYAIAERMEFEVLPNGEVQTFEMFDDTIKVKISKVDITTNEELPGAELVIKDKDGTEIDRWISTNGPHYVEKMPAGDYTLTEITAPNGYKVAESIDFTVLPTGEIQTVVMKDAREDTPTPTPDNTPTPNHTPQPTPNTTPAPAAPTAPPTPLLTIPKTGDNSPLGLLLAIAGISLAGLAVLVHKSARRKDIAPRDDDDEDTED